MSANESTNYATVSTLHAQASLEVNVSQGKLDHARSAQARSKSADVAADSAWVIQDQPV